MWYHDEEEDGIDDSCKLFVIEGTGWLQKSVEKPEYDIAPHSPNLRPKDQILAKGKEERASAFSPTLQIFAGRVSLNA